MENELNITFENKGTVTAVLKYLEEMFPNQIPPQRDYGIEDFRRVQGQQEVLQTIRNLVETTED